MRGRPFQPGDDPRRNTTGRPKGLAKQIRGEVEHDDGNDLVNLALACRTGQMLKQNAAIDAKTGKVKLDKNGDPDFSYEMVDLTVDQRIALMKILLERGYGKPPEYVPIEGEDPLDLGPDIQGAAEDFDKVMDELAQRRRARLAAQQQD